MKKLFTILLVLVMLISFTACGDNKWIDKKEYGTYGLFNESNMKNPNIKYHLIIGNIVWSIILVETIIAPIYFLGFSLYEPIRKLRENEAKDEV